MNHLELLGLNNDASREIIEKEITFSKEELLKEVDFIKEEGTFFLRLLNQSKYYSKNQDRQKIDELASNFEQLLKNEQQPLKRNLTKQLGEEVTNHFQEDNFNQSWLKLKKGFHDLKLRAMDLLGNFFTIRFQ